MCDKRIYWGPFLSRSNKVIRVCTTGTDKWGLCKRGGISLWGGGLIGNMEEVCDNNNRWGVRTYFIITLCEAL